MKFFGWWFFGPTHSQGEASQLRQIFYAGWLTDSDCVLSLCMMMKPQCIKIKRPYHHLGEDLITEFDAYTEVVVRAVDPDLVWAQKKECIDNAVALAEYADLECVQGFIRPKDAPVAFFHYWCWDQLNGCYYDATPGLADSRYYIKLHPSL